MAFTRKQNEELEKKWIEDCIALKEESKKDKNKIWRYMKPKHEYRKDL